jgi:hypothetical protein
MPTTMLTPVDTGPARQSGAARLWRKQLLPVGEIDYKGRKIAFTAEYLAGLARAFTDHAFDQVPFQLADGQNTHTNDPERFRGEIRGLEATADGLDLILAATEKGDEALRENPNLGVSARIVEDYQRADGKYWPAAIQHVLGTLDPRITGMRPWQAIEAANSDGEVIDLTDQQYPAPGYTPKHKHTEPPAPPPAQESTTGEDDQMALTAEQEARLAKLLDLPDDQFESLLAGASVPDDADAAGDTGEGADELTDEELADLLAVLEAGDSGDGAVAGDGDDFGLGDLGLGDGQGGAGDADLVPAGAGTQLTAEAQAAIDLANARAEETQLELARVTGALNRAAFEKERDHFAREYGIPPRITDMARQVLEGEGHVVELANGTAVDAGAVVRKVLTEFGKTVKALDLSGEIGTELDFSAEQAKAADDARAAERKDIVTAYRQQTGI